MRAGLLFVGVAAMACLSPAQADTFWHLRAGHDLFATGHVPLIDTYSHTARGLPWPNHEWLWQALSYGLFTLGGMPLLTAVAATFSTLACAISYRLMRAGPWINFGLAWLGVALASVVWALRPQVVSLLFLAVLVALLARKRLWPLPLLFLVWANVHGAVALGGLVLMIATGVSWFCDRRLCARLVILCAVCGALTAATPMGPRLWWFIGESIARSRQNQVMEWLPSYPPRGPIEIAFWLAAAGFIALLLLRWRRLASWEDRLIVAVAVILLPLGARAVRNISPFFLLWMPAVSRLLRKNEIGLRPVPHVHEGGAGGVAPEHPIVNRLLLAGAIVVASACVAMAWGTPWERMGWRPLPAPVIAAVSSCKGNLYNRYNEGGDLIWFAPDVPVFVDSRQDPYPAELLSAHTAAERTGDYQSLFARYQISCAVLPVTSPVAASLKRDAWLELYRDKNWVVSRHPP